MTSLREPHGKPARAKPETWLDWVPGTAEPPIDQLLTRAEFLDRLHDRGVDVNESKLVHWERAGALPRAVRHWHNGAPRAWYPPWLVQLAARVPDLQAEGLELREIGPRLRGLAPRFERVVAHDAGRVGVREEASVVVFPVPTARATAEGLAPTIVVGGRAVLSEAIEKDLAPVLRSLALRYQRITGARVVRVEGRLTDATGQTIAYGLDLSPE